MSSWSVTLTVIFITVFISCRNNINSNRIRYFPKTEIRVTEIPKKQYVWSYILAGQSNMAGRGLVEPRDTIPNERIFTINSKGELILAKEPIHFYEPLLTGLDCGLSFAKELTKYFPDSVYILIIPTAVGGTTIRQWLQDSTVEGVRLFSNFSDKMKIARTYGTLKGILWHQGENDADQSINIESYGNQLKTLIGKFRAEASDSTLPIMIGELGVFSKHSTNRQLINKQIENFARTDNNVTVISSRDLHDKGDGTHFNSQAQRLLGQRFGRAFIKRKAK